MKKLILLTFVIVLNTSLVAQSEEVCEGRYESILHDNNSGINQESLSRLEADEYNAPFFQDQ